VKKGISRNKKCGTYFHRHWNSERSSVRGGERKKGITLRQKQGWGRSIPSRWPQIRDSKFIGEVRGEWTPERITDGERKTYGYTSGMSTHPRAHDGPLLGGGEIRGKKGEVVRIGPENDDRPASGNYCQGGPRIRLIKERDGSQVGGGEKIYQGKKGKVNRRTDRGGADVGSFPYIGLTDPAQPYLGGL